MQTVPQAKCNGRTAEFVKYNRFYTINISEPSEIDFAICKVCFDTHVARTRLAHHWIIVQAKSDTEEAQEEFATLCYTCDFYPRVRRIWERECLPQNSIGPLVNFAKQAIKFEPCLKAGARQGGTYYFAKDNAIPGHSVCTTCFEQCFRGSQYERYFTSEVAPPESQWVCDIGQPGFIQGWLEKALPEHEHDFGFYANACNYRLQLPQCPRASKPLAPILSQGGHKQIMFTTNYGIGGNACQACYADKLELTSLQRLFYTKAPANDDTCEFAMSVGALPLLVATQRNELRYWQDAIKASLLTLECVGLKGVLEEEIHENRQKNQQVQDANFEWYSLRESPSTVICSRCFLCFVVPIAAGHLFEQVTRPLAAGVVRTCYISPVQSTETYNTRCQALRTTLCYAYDTRSGDFSRFFKMVKTLSQFGPSCGSNIRGYKAVNGRKWYGHLSQNQNDKNDCNIVICQECFQDLIQGGSLESQFNTDLTELVYSSDPQNKEVWCGPWSARAKAVLKEAGEKGDFGHFARYWNLRAEMMPKTKGQADAFRKLYQAQSMTKLNAMSNAMLAQGGASFYDAAAGDTGYRYGNSTVGYNHYSQAGADAAMQWNSAQNMQGGSGDLLMKAAMLEAEWRKYE